MFKKKIALLITLAMTVGIFSGCAPKSSSSTGSSGGEIKIGSIMSLTGPVSTYGKSGENGILLLEEQVNNAGGINGKKIKFVFGDDEGKPDTAITVGTKLISSDKVVAIVGPLISSACNAFGPIATQNKIPMVTGTGTNPDITTKGGEYVFRTCFIDPFQGGVLATFASGDLKAKKAAILFDNGNDYSKGLADYFEKGFKAAGGTVVKETYATNDKDFSAQLTKIKASNPDVVLLPDYYQTVGNIAKQARSIGIDVPFLGGDGWDSSKLFEVGGTAVNNCYLSDHYAVDDTSTEVVQFQKDYKAKYNGAIPDAMAVLNYDAAKILVDAIKAAGKTDGPSILEALKKTNASVVSGKVTFNENRDAVKSAVILKVDGGKFSFVKKINP
jgi:branched-chain amino acid transport system substrate-binding protein